MKIIFIRHGEPNYEIDSLTEKGWREAELLSKRTAKWNVTDFYCSPLRQLNRFLEFIEDILPKLPKEREVTILDFGCGKSYLTFAMYHYLHELKHYDVHIIGLDLKTDVIEKCNRLADKYVTLVKILNDKLAVLRHRGRCAVAGALPVGFPAERG